MLAVKAHLPKDWQCMVLFYWQLAVHNNAVASQMKWLLSREWISYPPILLHLTLISQWYDPIYGISLWTGEKTTIHKHCRVLLLDCASSLYYHSHNGCCSLLLDWGEMCESCKCDFTFDQTTGYTCYYSVCQSPLQLSAVHCTHFCRQKAIAFRAQIKDDNNMQWCEI